MPASWRAVALRTSLAGVPRRIGCTHIEGTGPQLSGHRQRSHPGDESAQRAVSQLGHSLYRPKGLFPAPPRRLAGKTDPSRRASSSRATLSTTRPFAAAALGSTTGAVGGESETSGEWIAAADSLAGPGAGGPSDRATANAPSIPHQTAVVGLQRSGIGDADQRRPTGAVQETADPARSQCQS